MLMKKQVKHICWRWRYKPSALYSSSIQEVSIACSLCNIAQPW